jgi:peptidoglycan/xylan/chitin deacetylase (PgdA/CDA1 family)
MRRYSKSQIASVSIFLAILIAVFLLFTSVGGTTRRSVSAAVVKQLGVFPPNTLPPVGPKGTIYLSFDDGPDPIATPQVLATLRHFGAHATFFTVGSFVKARPELALRAYSDGNSVQNHTYDHHTLRHVSQPVFDYEVDRDQQTIGNAIGVLPGCVRAPYDDFDQEVIARLNAKGLQLVGWTVDSDDWKKPGVDQIVANVMNNVRPGSIILMHDGGGDSRAQTVAALKRIIPELRDRGYGFGLLCREQY